MNSSGKLIVTPTLLIAICSILNGCSNEKVPPLATVTGHVKIANEPLSGAVVFFHPTNGVRVIDGVAHGRESIAKTDGSGFFSLTHFSGHSGAELGEHEIAIQIPGKEKEEIPSGTTAIEAHRMSQPTSLALGEFSSMEVTEGENTFEITLPADAIPDTDKERAAALYQKTTGKALDGKNKK